MKRHITPISGDWMKITRPSRITRGRNRLGYTQTDLAHLVGCTQQYISMLERGADTDCSEAIASEICRRLDIELEDVFETRECFGSHPETSINPGYNRRAA